ncbi:MAG: hypothetical protein ACRDHF_19255 [Tepidiformaceae bacterium]
MTPKQTPEQFLVKLGRTPDEIAKSLVRRGIRGERQSHAKCPIGVALLLRFGTSVLVRYRRISFGDLADVKPPPAVARFLRAFDGGKFPELEA